MRKIKISCLPMSFYDDIRSEKMNIREWAETAKKIGFDGIDINMFFLDGMTIDEIKVLKDELALPVHLVTSYTDFTNPDDEIRKKEIVNAIENMKKVDAIGAEYIRLTAGPWHSDIDQEEAIDNVCDCIIKCERAAEELDVKIVFENHSVTSVWEAPDFVFNIDNWTKMWEALQGGDTKVNFDIASAWLLKDWKSILEAAAGDIETVQINDFSDTSPLECTVIGEGQVCIDMILKAVFDSGYNGWISIEDYSLKGVEGLKKALVNVRKICKKF